MSKSGRLHFFAFYPDNFVGGTMFLSDEALGCYMRLLVAQWYRGSLPNDVEELVPIAMTVRQHWAVLADKFPVCEDGLRRNRRLEEEREKAAGRTERAKSGAHAKWEAKRRRQAEHVPDAQALLKHCASTANASSKQMQRASISGSSSESLSSSVSEAERPKSASEFRAREKDAIDSELDALAQSNGHALYYALWNTPHIREAWERIPHDFRGKPNVNVPLFAVAVRDAAMELAISEPEAAKHVAGRLEAYCESDTGKLAYRGNLETWLKAGRWRESDAAWKRKPTKDPKPERKEVEW